MMEHREGTCHSRPVKECKLPKGPFLVLKCETRVSTKGCSSTSVTTYKLFSSSLLIQRQGASRFRIESELVSGSGSRKR